MSTSVVPVTSGLYGASGEPVPLLGVSVEAQIRDFGATVVVSQRYRNDERQAIEAVYKFPLDEGAAVCGFEAEIGGRRVVGRVEEREKAFAAYDDALAAGHGAYLLDEERADVFTVSVGNVPPGQEVVLRITTVAELAREGDDVRFTLPTTIAPRYAPAEDRRGVGVSEAERVNPPVALTVPYGLQLAVDVEMSAAVRGVESPSHPIAVSIDGRHASVSLAAREAALDCDFVLKIALAEGARPGVLVERGGDGAAYALVSFHPQFEARPVACEVVFLVDRSGSMQGASIAEAKNALQLCLRSLRPGCRFNVIGFGNHYQPLFPESRAYDEDTLREAARHVREIEADMGGTEILPALEFALRPTPVEGLPRQLFLITDGEVSNTDAVIALAGEHAGRTRVFAFGVGASASQHLVKGVARAGLGEAEFIAPGERIEGKVMRQLGRALSVALSDVGVEWGDLAVEQAPHLPPPVFDGGRVLVYGRLDRLDAPATVVLKAKGPDGELRFELPVTPDDVKPGQLVATLWARRRIRDLEEGVSALHPPRGSRQARAKSVDDRVREEVIRIGRQYGLVSRETSYVAVEERADGAPGEILLRKVPSALARGWHGAPLMAAAPLQPFAAADEAQCFELDAAEPTLRRSAPAAALLRMFSRSAGPAAPDASVRALDRLMELQFADGTWKLNEDLATVVGIPLARLLDLLKAIGARPGVPFDKRVKVAALSRAQLDEALKHLGETGAPVDRVVATAVALRWLEEHCADTREEWRLAAEKSEAWLRRNAGPDTSWLHELLRAFGV